MRHACFSQSSPLLGTILTVLVCAGCQTTSSLDIPMCSGPFLIDGALDEACYSAAEPLNSFVVAGQSAKPAPATKAWVFWNAEQFVFAFECEDATFVAKEPSENENDVDPQDRIELFLWSGNPEDTYYCLEIAPLGAVHDYAARFYRQFDNAWEPAGWQCATAITGAGYRVEAATSREAMAKCGFMLEPGLCFRAGLFRADFPSWEAGAVPDWITWVDARTPQPDFHVAGSFGTFELRSGIVARGKRLE